MALAIVHTRAKTGIHSPAVTVEVHLSNGLPSLSIVGLPETAVKESKDRVRSALINAHFDFPPRRITVNLAPADLPKEGGRYDLAIALGILAASGQLPTECLSNYEFIGELALSGELRGVSGVLPAALASARENRQMIVALDNAEEAALSKKTIVYGARHLLEVCAHLRSSVPLNRARNSAPYVSQSDKQLSDVIGQQQAKRALEIAAAGGHNLLLSGPPGTGKTMLAARLPGILPPLSEDEALEVAAVYSVAGNGVRSNLYERPFRSPHHSASAAALVGGGTQPTPGEISLAHNGVLFLDELPEYPRKTLEVLREPLESGSIAISRVRARIEFPARFLLVAAMNPCPCGYFGLARCRCTPDQIQRYQSKISGPLLDRFDLQVSVPAISKTELTTQTAPGKSDVEIQHRVYRAQQLQQERQSCTNSALSSKQLLTICPLDNNQKHLLNQAIDRLGLSARAYHRLLKVARTIADLDASSKDKKPEQSTMALQSHHLTEAIAYRMNSVAPLI